MPDARPAWDDESLAGTLIPGTRPTPPGFVLTNRFRAEQEADAARRREERARAQSPGVQEAEWEAARRQARMEMRRERRQERIAAGIEAGTADSDWQSLCVQWVNEVEHGVIDSAPFAAFAEALKAMAEQLSAAFAIPASLLSPPQPKSSMDGQTRLLEEMLANGGWSPALSHEAAQRATRSMDALAKPLIPTPKAPPPRERYLPGTRHAGKNRRR